MNKIRKDIKMQHEEVRSKIRAISESDRNRQRSELNPEEIKERYEEVYFKRVVDWATGVSDGSDCTTDRIRCSLGLECAREGDNSTKCGSL